MKVMVSYLADTLDSFVSGDVVELHPAVSLIGQPYAEHAYLEYLENQSEYHK